MATSAGSEVQLVGVDVSLNVGTRAARRRDSSRCDQHPPEPEPGAVLRDAPHLDFHLRRGRILRSTSARCSSRRSIWTASLVRSAPRSTAPPTSGVSALRPNLALNLAIWLGEPGQAPTYDRDVGATSASARNFGKSRLSPGPLQGRRSRLSTSPVSFAARSFSTTFRSRFRRVRSTPCSARTGPARRRCFGFSRVSRGRAPARFESPASMRRRTRTSSAV